MKLTERVTLFVNQTAADVKALFLAVGAVSSLTTTDKTSLVAAINEVKALAGSGGVTVNDASTTSTTQPWSAQKSTTAIAALKTELLGGADAAWDTLNEIKAFVVADESTAAALATAVNKRIRFDSAQVLTGGEMLQACENLGIGNPDTDFLAAYNAAKA